ncbi:MAG: hypothetical protein LBJ60_07645 [Tannerellaceae bacterium]|nr:hypothetical protein [Tannerellaceae bacterium]
MEKKDFLEDLFSGTPQEELPVDFQKNVMRQVYAESVKMKKRNERFGLLSVIAASLLLLALAATSILYLVDLPEIEWRLPDLLSMPFYLYIGALALLLLLGDYKLRKFYEKRYYN